MSSSTLDGSVTPWYRQFWPWFLILLPATVVVAAIATLIIADKGADDLVASEYYKEGLAINQRLEKEQRARTLGISATLSARENTLYVMLQGPSEAPYLDLSLSHPLEADRDMIVTVRRIAPGQYSAELPDISAGRWHWSLSPQNTEDWRLNGVLSNSELTGRRGPE